MRGVALVALFAFAVTAWAAPPQAGLKIEISIVDQSNLAVPAVRVELKAADAALMTSFGHQIVKTCADC
jgi:hypothetical protein